MKMQLQEHMHVQVYLDFLHIKIFYFVKNVILFFLVFHRKDLCDARPKPEVSS